MADDRLSAALDEIRGREQAATKGPWRLITDSCDCGDGYGCSHGSWPCGFRLTVPRQVVTGGRAVPTEDWHYEYSEIPDLPMEAAEFMVAARADVPRLLAALDAVLALHQPYQHGSDCLTCRTCFHHGEWPCTEYKAISAALLGEEAPDGG